MLSFLFLLQIFHPETTDIYDKKNMPRVVYCIHALRLLTLGLCCVDRQWRSESACLMEDLRYVIICVIIIYNTVINC